MEIIRVREKVLNIVQSAKRLLLFDFDGVLVSSLDVYEQTVKLCLEKIGQPVVKTREDFLDLFDDNFYEAIARKGVDLKAFMEASVDILAGVNFNEITPHREIFPVLERMETDSVLVIISSNASDAIRHALKKYSFNGAFREILGSDFDLSKRRKIDYAMEKYGVGKDDTFYIGDTVGDILEAKLAGVRSVAVTWGWHDRDRLAASHPDFLAETPEDLLKIGGTKS